LPARFPASSPETSLGSVRHENLKQLMTKFALTLVLLVSIGASALAQGGYTTRSFDVQMRI